MERRKGVRVVTAMPLAEVRLGISGIADVVEFHQEPHGEQAFPVEYKRGRPKAHRADEVQLCAQALCLESMLDQQIHAGALYYGATRRRVDVCFDDELRQLTLDTIAAVRSMLAAGVTLRLSITHGCVTPVHCWTCASPGCGARPKRQCVAGPAMAYERRGYVMRRQLNTLYVTTEGLVAQGRCQYRHGSGAAGTCQVAGTHVGGIGLFRTCAGVASADGLLRRAGHMHQFFT